MTTVKSFAIYKHGEALKPFEFSLGPIGAEQVDISVDYCGLCHSDLSMINNEWGISSYPLVPGHEVAGRISAVGSAVKTLKVGDKVGLGWYSTLWWNYGL